MGNEHFSVLLQKEKQGGRLARDASEDERIHSYRDGRLVLLQVLLPESIDLLVAIDLLLQSTMKNNA
jgi:hypothetical protein